ncbi:MAG: 4-alpha-glucanotransferase [Candidatus Omnitrophica bacterium]|nr:4-alpha-glucanotransferase [Candidatus Omnitrophota bacterium]
MPYDYLLDTASKERWKRIGVKRRAGLVVPLFSIYSKESLGIGEFPDLKLLVDLCEKSGHSIIQLLPLNEVGPLLCPYDALSSFALEPAYISLSPFAAIKKNSFKKRLSKLRGSFRLDKAHLDYQIKQEKTRLLWDIFLEEDFYSSLEFNKFRQENTYWVESFALFKVLKESQGGLAWYDWEEKYRTRINPEVEAFSKSHEIEITFQVWLQWWLYKQLREAKNYASAKEVLFKGDLPILVSRDSADVWSRPDFFKLDFAAGAPPDMYCAKGQRWGMPTYNWENIASDGYRYIREKLKYAQEFYDILRIDHMVGLLRIWSIPYKEPLENQGLNGLFDPVDEAKWEEHGRNLLSAMLGNTRMLLCAEDLGVIPPACTRLLKDFGIPGNDVQRWNKDWKIKYDFLGPLEYRQASVSMLSTHDTTNWSAWWEYEAGTVDEQLFMRKCSGRLDYNYVKDKLFDPALSRYGRLRWLKELDSADKLVDILGKKKEELLDFIDLYNNSYKEKEKLWIHLGLQGPMREKADPEIVKAALKITLDSRSIFCINTIIDWLYLTGLLKGDPYQYRTNTPGTIKPENWSLVLPLPLEELLQHGLLPAMKEMNLSSDRA